MNEITPTKDERIERLQGMGCKRKRVEDIRFVQGKGSYVDDLKLPGMLYGDFVRSPYGHARIKKIDASKATALPGVLAVLTAAELKPLSLHYMPTLAGDVQAVLAEEKVLFQNQEVAFVIAEDRYVVADAVELVEVEYEALPILVDPFKSMTPDAPLLREDIKDKTDGAHGKRKHYNHIFAWEIGDREATDDAFKKAEVSIKELGYRPEPFAIVDALMYADGKPIVEITDMSLRMTGLDREELGRIWANAGRSLADSGNLFLPLPLGEGRGEGHRNLADSRDRAMPVLVGGTTDTHPVPLPEGEGGRKGPIPKRK